MICIPASFIDKALQEITKGNVYGKKMEFNSTQLPQIEPSTKKFFVSVYLIGEYLNRKYTLLKNEAKSIFCRLKTTGLDAGARETYLLKRTIRRILLSHFINSYREEL